MTRLLSTFFSALLMGLCAILSSNIFHVSASGVPTVACSDHSRIQCRANPNCSWRKKKCLPAPNQQVCLETTKKRFCKKLGCIWKAKTCHSKNQHEVLNPWDDNSQFWKSLMGEDATSAETKIDFAFSDFYRVYVCPNQFTPAMMHQQCLTKILDDRRVRLVVSDNKVVETPCPG